MTDNEITREKTFSEELPYFKERIKEVFDNYDNPNGYEDPLYIAVLRDSKRIVRKAEEEINRQSAEIERLQNTLDDVLDRQPKLVANAEKYMVEEFANKIKNHKQRMFSSDWSGDYQDDAVRVEIIDNLVKEMISKEELE